ncbi:hypothetical protein [Halorubellus litoreus]|uniref:Secreted protein n=1 Tax=Halorubellus litoreus TaxID=755308 RepID=A0ABD5VGG7_9EURY
MKRRPALRGLLAAGVGALAGCVGSLEQTAKQTTQPPSDDLVDCFFPEDGVGFHVRNGTDASKAVSVRIERHDDGDVYDETLELAARTDDGTGHVWAPDGVFPEPDRYVTTVSTGDEQATDARRVATQCDRPSILLRPSEGIHIGYFGRD